MIELLKYTENPLDEIGKIAGICWNSSTNDIEKNIKRAKSCIKSGHDRVMEYVDITVIISEYSARCIRELGRHIIGTTYLQESTRYVNCNDFDYYEPEAIIKIKHNDKEIKAEKEYSYVMNTISQSYNTLLDCGISKEDAANILPLGMNTKIIWKINLRALIHFMNMRLCSRALMEIRQLCIELKTKLAHINDEWKWICDELLVPKCEIIGYCIEEKCCGKKPKGLDGLKEKIIKEYIKNKNKIIPILDMTDYLIATSDYATKRDIIKYTIEKYIKEFINEYPEEKIKEIQINETMFEIILNFLWDYFTFVNEEDINDNLSFFTRLNEIIGHYKDINLIPSKEYSDNNNAVFKIILSNNITKTFEITYMHKED